MRKSIFAISLYFSLNVFATGQAVADPLALFIEQCLSFNSRQLIPIPTAWKKANLSKELTNLPSQQILDFSQGLLVLNNLNDRNQYYRTLLQRSPSTTVDNDLQQGLLFCQIHLADELNHLLSSINADAIAESATNLPPDYANYALHIAKLNSKQWTPEQKSRIRGLQAGISHALAQPYAISTDNICKLDNTTGNNVNQISKYLSLQSDSNCRYHAWNAYQGRTNARIKPQLIALHKQYHQLAINAGFSNYAQYQVAQLGITTDELSQFLDSQTHKLDYAPWDLPHKLKRFVKSQYRPQTAKAFIEQVSSVLQKIGITLEPIIAPLTSANDIEPIHPNMTTYRLWLNERLLGEVIFELETDALSNTPIPVTAYTIKRTVVGEQFGQTIISAPSLLTSFSQHQQFIEAFAKSLVDLANGQAFYYPEQVQHQIAQQWLTLWLAAQVEPETINDNKQVFIAKYQQQMRVLKSKAALKIYQSEDLQIVLDEWALFNQEMNSIYQKSFSGEWQNAGDIIYSHRAIANQGISYYLLLWQEALARLVYEHTSSTNSPDKVFDILVVNESHHSLFDQLANLFEQPMDFETLLRRMNYAGNQQE